jgi:hypothetical protein
MRQRLYQDAANVASRADQALSIAQAAYNQAVATANRLAQEAAQAEQAAKNAENEYQKLKHEYDKQQAEKNKPKKHPGPRQRSTTCVHPTPRPRPIRPPAPPHNGPKPGPGQNPGPSQTSNPASPGDSPTPSTSGADQGSGSGGGGGAPACIPEEGGGPQSLKSLADQVRLAGRHPAAINQRVIAIGEDSQGQLHAGSSSYFDAGQRAALRELGIGRVPPIQGYHAEEEILTGVPDLVRIGISGQPPCGPEAHDCLGQLTNAGVEIEC